MRQQLIKITIVGIDNDFRKRDKNKIIVLLIKKFSPRSAQWPGAYFWKVNVAVYLQ